MPDLCLSLSPGSIVVRSGSSLSNDVSLSSWTINAQGATDEGTTNVANGVSSPEFLVTLTDANAEITEVSISPTASNFQSLGAGAYSWNVAADVGDTPTAFTVTAENGTTTAEYNNQIHRLNTGVAEVSKFEALGTAGGTPFQTGGTALGFAISNATARLGVWYNTGTEGQPDFSGDGVTTYLEVVINVSDGNGPIVVATNNALDTNGFSINGSNELVDDVAGARTDPNYLTMPIGEYSLTVITQGENPT